LMKPFTDEALLNAIRGAIELSRSILDRTAEIQMLADRYRMLSVREREVMALVTTGLLNKQVAFDLGISEVTVKVHRGRVMRKMRAESLVDLAAMAAKLRLGDTTAV